MINIFKSMIRLAVVFSFQCMFVPAVLAQEIPQAQGRVNDFAGVISSQYREKITQVIDRLETATSAEIAVVTIPSIAPYDEFTYSQKLFDEWKIGKKDKDNGVLILVAVNDRRWRIHTGYGMEGILPDSICAAIGRDWLVPYLRNNDYSEGLFATVDKIAEIISRSAGVPFQAGDVSYPVVYYPHTYEANETNLFSVFMVIVFFPLFLIGLVNFYRSIFINPKAPLICGSINNSGPDATSLRNVGGVFFVLAIVVSVWMIKNHDEPMDLEFWKVLGFINMFLMGPVFILNGFSYLINKYGGKDTGSGSGGGGYSSGSHGGGYSGGGSSGGGGFGGGSSGGGGAGGRY